MRGGVRVACAAEEEKKKQKNKNKNKKDVVVVTGGLGFIGSHVCTSLLAEGETDVVCVDAMKSASVNAGTTGT